MYFQNLENLKTNINNRLLEDFDAWLGTMAPLYARKINASDYAIREKIDMETCIRLFDLAVEKRILSPKIIVIDDYGMNYGTYKHYKDVPLKVTNYEYDIEIILEDRNKEIIYELIAAPKEQAALVNFDKDKKKKSSSPETVTVGLLVKTNAAATLTELGADF
ncbi:hypothetical protein [Enterococcus mundtii]|uniref:hypothetical protein n=1 Tax=Enterococcus mundtii TaxID=53346 RepID=UPI001376635B|nr:hypothetical protein [Enterococcus mundtii]NBA63081.1 hypothetical protein [Enterococcus mundtii]